MPSNSSNKKVLKSLFLLKNMPLYSGILYYSFINSYHYNFNENIFVEDMNNNHISNSNIIKEENIIYSLNTHGIGIINSIINKLYQIISLHLKNILEIAVDDYIKFLLISEEKIGLIELIKEKIILV